MIGGVNERNMILGETNLVMEEVDLVKNYLLKNMTVIEE
jgi:hypothetical protein